MFAAWRVAVVLSATNLTGPAFAQFASQAEGAERVTARLKSTLNSVRLVAATAFIGAGAALSSFVAHGMDEAGKFELAMKNVAIATGATGKTLRDLQGMAIDLSGRTSQDATQIALEMAKASSAGLSNSQLMRMMPQIAEYADVQMRAHGTDPVKATSEAVQAAHLTRSYGYNMTTFRGKKVTDLQAMLEFMNELSFSQPEDMSRVITQMGYFAPQGKALGLTLDDVMDSLAVMGQTGYLRGKGGTGLAQIINGAINTVAVTNHKQSKKTEALLGLGLVDKSGRPVYVNDKGQLNWPEMAAHLRKISENTRPDWLHQMFVAAFNINGGRMADIMFNKDTERQRLQTRAKMDHSIPTIEEAQSDYLKQYSVAWNTFWTNITNATIGTFMPLVIKITPYINQAAAAVQEFAKFMIAHPDIGLKVSLALIGASVLSFGAGLVLVAGMAWSATRSVWALAAAASALSATSGGGAVGAVVGDATLVAGSAAGGGLLTRIGAGLSKALMPIVDGSLLAKMLTPTGFGKEFGRLFANDAVEGLLSALRIMTSPVRLVLTPLIQLGAALGGVSIGVAAFFAAVALGTAWVATHPFEFGHMLYEFDQFLRGKMMPAVSKGAQALLSVATTAFVSVMGVVGKFIAWLGSTLGSFLSNPLAFLSAPMRASLGAQGDISAFSKNMMEQLKLGAYGAAPVSTAGYGNGKSIVSPGGGTTIQKVDIIIQGSPDHEKTAKAVAKVLTKQTSFRTRAAGGTTNSPYLKTQLGF